MGFDDAKFRLAVWNWVTSVLDIPQNKVIWENQSEHRPQKPYVSMLVTVGPLKRGSDDLDVDVDGKTVVSGNREMTVAINYFGSNAVGNLASLQITEEFPSIVEAFEAQDIALIEDSGIRDLTTLLENRFESRAQMDVRFRVSDVAKDEFSTFVQTVKGTLVLNGVAQVAQSFTLTKP